MNITVTARRWDGGWELILDDHHATQVRTLDRAAQQVRDYLDTDDSAVDHSQWDVRIVLDDDDLATRLDAARAATAAAAIAQSGAAAASRIVVRDLRARGVSVTDCAALLGLSRGRISQLSA